MPAVERSQFSLELLTEVLAETRAMRRSLRVLGLETPALDAEVAALEGAVAAARSDCRPPEQHPLNTQSPGSREVSGPNRQILSDGGAKGGGDMPANPKKLTPETVVKIRAMGALAAAGLTSQRAIAAHFRLSQSTVCDIISGKLWPICPTTTWTPKLRAVDIRIAERAVQGGGRFGGPGGVVTLPNSDDRTSLPDGDDVDAVSVDDTTNEDAAQ